MPRSGAGARDRLERAALELYREQGFDQTTAAQIASRAGVTERTFFRHFADKREVMFKTERMLLDAMADALRHATGDSPRDLMLDAFRSMAPLMAEQRAVGEERHRIIAANPALQERELSKAAGMAALVADELHSRGLPPWHAGLMAQVGTAALGFAVYNWLSDPSSAYEDVLERAFADLSEFAEVKQNPDV